MVPRGQAAPHGVADAAGVRDVHRGVGRGGQPDGGAPRRRRRRGSPVRLGRQLGLMTFSRKLPGRYGDWMLTESSLPLGQMFARLS